MKRLERRSSRFVPLLLLGVLALSGLTLPLATGERSASPPHGTGPVVADLARSAAAPALAPVGVTFNETGLPNGTAWTIVTWPLEIGLGNASVATASNSSDTVPVPLGSVALGFLIGTSPTGTTGFVWAGTASPAGVVSTLANATVNVTFSNVSIGSLPEPIHVAETGLPASSLWTFSFDGRPIAVNATSAAVTTTGGTAYSVTPIPQFWPNATEYVTGGYALLNLTPGARWDNVTGTNLSIGAVAFAPVLLVAHYVVAYRLTVVPGNGGSTTPPTEWVRAGGTVVLTATPDGNATFAGWSGWGPGAVNDSVDPVVSVTVEGPVEMLATFLQDLYSITVHEVGVPAGESYSVLWDGSLYTSNTSTWQLPRVQAGSYNFSLPDSYSNLSLYTRFIGRSFSSSFPRIPGSSTFEVWRNGTFNVTFGIQFGLIVGAVGPGTISPLAGSYWVDAGTIQTLVATPSAGYGLIGWSGTGQGSISGRDTLISVQVEGPVSETAQFGLAPPPPTFAILLTETGLPAGTNWTAVTNATGGSSNSSTLSIANLANGSYVVTVPTVYASPGLRYVAPGPSNVLVNGGATLTVPFSPQYGISVTIGTGGSVGPFPSWVASGTTVSLAAGTPLPGYKFLGWAGTFSSSGTVLVLVAHGPINETAEFVPNGPSTPAPNHDLLEAGAIGVGGLVIGLIVSFLIRRRPPASH